MTKPRRPPAPDVSVERAQLERLRREQDADARAAQTYGRRPDIPPSAPSVPVTPSAPAEQRPKRTRRDPPGMARRSLYLADSTWAALHDAANQVQAATGGLVSKHEAIGILIDLAVQHVDDAVDRARVQVQQRLTNS